MDLGVLLRLERPFKCTPAEWLELVVGYRTVFALSNDGYSKIGLQNLPVSKRPTADIVTAPVQANIDIAAKNDVARVRNAK